MSELRRGVVQRRCYWDLGMSGVRGGDRGEGIPMIDFARGAVLGTGPVLKYPGSKGRLADWIISYFPPHHSYLEPFFGSGAVLFKKTPSNIETVNDLDYDVVNLFCCIREDAARLARLVEFTPYSRHEYDNVYWAPVPDCNYERARQFLTRCCQGHGFRVNQYKVGWKNDVQGRESAYAVRHWNDLPARIIHSVQRLKQVQIECMPAVELINRFKFPDVCIYCDPPYVFETRTSHAKQQYKHEMTDSDHVELLDALDAHPGPVLLSGYACDLYDDRLAHWKRETHQARAEKGEARTEVLWLNPIAAEGLAQQRLF